MARSSGRRAVEGMICRAAGLLVLVPYYGNFRPSGPLTRALGRSYLGWSVVPGSVATLERLCGGGHTGLHLGLRASFIGDGSGKQPEYPFVVFLAEFESVAEGRDLYVIGRELVAQPVDRRTMPARRDCLDLLLSKAFP